MAGGKTQKTRNVKCTFNVTNTYVRRVQISKEQRLTEKQTKEGMRDCGVRQSSNYGNENRVSDVDETCKQMSLPKSKQKRGCATWKKHENRVGEKTCKTTVCEIEGRGKDWRKSYLQRVVGGPGVVRKVTLRCEPYN